MNHKDSSGRRVLRSRERLRGDVSPPLSGQGSWRVSASLCQVGKAIDDSKDHQRSGLLGRWQTVVAGRREDREVASCGPPGVSRHVDSEASRLKAVGQL